MATATTKKATRPRAKKEEPKVKYLLLGGKGDFVIEVPESWRLTFGAVNPGGPTHGRDMHCVRVWAGQKLRAVYCDVRGFRDLSIPLARKIDKEVGETKWTMDSAGNFEGERKVTHEDGGYQLDAGQVEFA